MMLWIAVLVITMGNLNLYGQVPNFETKQNTTTSPLELFVTTAKTTNLVFASAIKSVDRGSRDVLVQKAKNVENVLQVKAAKDSFEQTSLSIITADGSIHSFIVNYSREPHELSIEISPKDREQPSALFSEVKDFNSKLAEVSEKVIWKNTSTYAKFTNHKMRIALTGIYSNENLLFFKINIGNATKLDYEVDQFRFFIQDKKKSKRTATQSVELTPEYIHGNALYFHGNTDKRLVVALKRFNIPDKKNLIIQLIEKNGGRHLNLKIKNRTILKTGLIH